MTNLRLGDKLAFWGLMLLLIVYLWGTLPGTAHAATPAPQPKVEQKVEKVPMWDPRTEVIIRDPRALPQPYPEGPIDPDPKKRLKDPRAWA